jgi:mRNA-degrading endonuclease YafQ of YafQ-DinJ toxin-antitoxin module
VFTIVTPERFLRQARGFFKQHPDLKPRFAKLVTDLQNDPFAPNIRMHPLKGQLAGCHTVRLTYSYCVTLTLAILDKEIVLLDIGSHDEVYR